MIYTPSRVGPWLHKRSAFCVVRRAGNPASFVFKNNALEWILC
jgi:hypothetical protein